MRLLYLHIYMCIHSCVCVCMCVCVCVCVYALAMPVAKRVLWRGTKNFVFANFVSSYTRGKEGTLNSHEEVP